jgi:hypothetical protein
MVTIHAAFVVIALVLLQWERISKRFGVVRVKT